MGGGGGNVIEQVYMLRSKGERERERERKKERNRTGKI